MERPPLKDRKATSDYIDHIERELHRFTESSYAASYLSLKMVVDNINYQMKKINITLTDESDDKVFNTISKYAKQLAEYTKQMDYFKKNMTPEEVKAAEEKELGPVERQKMKHATSKV